MEAEEADSFERAKITYSGRRWSASKFVHKRFKLPKRQLLSNVPGYRDPVDGGRCGVEANEEDATGHALIHCDFKLAVTRKSRPCRATLRVLIKQIAA